MSQRQHVYFDAKEAEVLERLAGEHDTSLSFIVRMAVRMMVGLPVGDEWRKLAEREQRARGRVPA